MQVAASQGQLRKGLVLVVSNTLNYFAGGESLVANKRLIHGVVISSNV